MNIERIIVGDLQTNCYIIEKDNKVLVIDPGDEFLKIKKQINNREVLGVIITHYHYDHIGALDLIINEYKVKVYDNNNLDEGINKIGPFTFEMLKTPGHKEDLISIYFKEEKVMFVGDFIFKGTIGRTDLEGSNPDDMQKSIMKIKKYPLDTIIYPGHGVKTTLEYEVLNNPFFN